MKVCFFLLAIGSLNYFLKTILSDDASERIAALIFTGIYCFATYQFWINWGWK